MGKKKTKQVRGKTARVNTMASEDKANDNANNTQLQDTETSDKLDDSNWFDSNPEVSDLLMTPLPDTPLKQPASKKTKRDLLDHHDSSSEILSAIHELSGKYDKMLQKISAIELSTGATAKQMETLSSTVTQLVMDVAVHKESLSAISTEIQAIKKTTKSMKLELGECKRYSWKWTLKLHGVKEKEAENTRGVTVDILSNVVPGMSDDLERVIDIAHRVGPKRMDGKPRSIILFALRRFRDIIWQAAKGCKFLNSNQLRLTEALSPEDRLAREKLWPLIKQARDKGKKASYRSSYALIDGQKYNYSEVE